MTQEIDQHVVSPPGSIYTEDKSTESTLLLEDLDYLSTFLSHDETPQGPVSPTVKHTLERQRKSREDSFRKKRHIPELSKEQTKQQRNKRPVEGALPANNQKRVRVADTLLFIKEGFVIAEQDLTDSVRALHITEGESAQPPRKWYHSRKLWAGVAVATTVAVASVVLGRRKQSGRGIFRG